MKTIPSRFTYAGEIKAYRKPTEEEAKAEIKLLRRMILSHFLDDCSFAMRTRQGCDAFVTITFHDKLGAGRAGKIIVNPIKGPNGEEIPMMPGIPWRWSALHDIWECVSSDDPDSPHVSSRRQTYNVLQKVMYGNPTEPEPTSHSPYVKTPLRTSDGSDPPSRTPTGSIGHLLIGMADGHVPHGARTTSEVEHMLTSALDQINATIERANQEIQENEAKKNRGFMQKLLDFIRSKG